MAKRKVARFQPAQVAQHLGLAGVGVEDRMSEVGRSAVLDFRFAISRRTHVMKNGAVFAEESEQLFHVFGRGRFVEGNADALRAEEAEVAVLARRAP